MRGGGPQTPGGALSGGNQQKVVLAREIDRDPRVLIAAQPTRGLDVGAIEFVHRRLIEERDEGRGDPARLARARGDPLALRPDPRHLRGRDRRRVHAVSDRGGARNRDDRRRARTGGGGVSDLDDTDDPSDPVRPRPGGAAVAARDVRPRPEGRRPDRARADRRARVLRRRPRRLRDDRQEPAHDVPGHLRRGRVQLVLPLGHRRRAQPRGPEHAADPDPDDDADPHRARGRLRVSVRPLQHRRDRGSTSRARCSPSGSARRSRA